MKKFTLRLLSCVLGATTLFGTVPIKVTATTRNNRQEKSLTPAAKIGIGAGAVVLVGGIVLACYLASRNSDTDDSIPYSGNNNSVTNANLSNRDNLCFWHSFMQQMYSLKTFRKFIDETDLSTVNSTTAEKICAFRDFFAKMGSRQKIYANECVEFAKKLMGNKYTAEQQDIHEVFGNFIVDVSNEYDKFCRQKYASPIATQPSNVLNAIIKIEKEKPTLKDLLTTTDSPLAYANMRNAVKVMLTNGAKRQEILKAYVEHYYKTKVSTVDENSLRNLDIPIESADEVTLLTDFVKNQITNKDNEDRFYNIIANELYNDLPQNIQEELQPSKYVSIDVPALDDQFVVFVNRTGFDDHECETKVSTKIDFGDGTVMYKNRKFQATAISTHAGPRGRGGHYITYKKEKNGNWYKYNDCSDSVPYVTWNEVVEDASKNCTMLTFSAVN